MIACSLPFAVFLKETSPTGSKEVAQNRKRTSLREWLLWWDLLYTTRCFFRCQWPNGRVKKSDASRHTYDSDPSNQRIHYAGRRYLRYLEFFIFQVRIYVYV